MMRGAAIGTGASVPAAFVLLLPMEAGVPIPVPADLVMLLFGERVADGSFPLWAAVVALEVVAVAGSAALFLFARGPGHALVTRIGPRVGLTSPRLERAVAMIETRGRAALVVGRATPGLRTVTTVAAGASGLSARRALPALVLGRERVPPAPPRARLLPRTRGARRSRRRARTRDHRWRCDRGCRVAVLGPAAPQPRRYADVHRGRMPGVRGARLGRRTLRSSQRAGRRSFRVARAR